MTVSLRLDDELNGRLAAAAEAAGVSKSEYIRQCLSDRLVGAETIIPKLASRSQGREGIDNPRGPSAGDAGIRLSSELTSADLRVVIRPQGSRRSQPSADEASRLIESVEFEGWTLSVYRVPADESGADELDWDFHIEAPPERLQGRSLVRMGTQLDDRPPSIEDPAEVGHE
jgi:hypothetical protein